GRRGGAVVDVFVDAVVVDQHALLLDRVDARALVLVADGVDLRLVEIGIRDLHERVPARIGDRGAHQRAVQRGADRYRVPAGARLLGGGFVSGGGRFRQGYVEQLGDLVGVELGALRCRWLRRGGRLLDQR